MENEVSEAFLQVSSLFLGQATGHPVVRRHELNNRRHRSQKRAQLASLAATFSILTLFFMWSVCTASRSREQAVGMTRRRLAGGDGGIDEEEESVLEGCLALEAELGIWRPEPPSTSHGDRSRRIAELVSFFSAAASEYEANQEMQSTQGEGPNIGGVSDVRQTDTGIAAVGWLRTLESGSGEPVLGRTAAKLKSAKLKSPDAFASGMASEVKSSELIEESEGAGEDQSEHEECQWPVDASHLPPSAAPSTVCILASANLPVRTVPKIPRSSNDPRLHPYVRMPVVEAGVFLQDFDPSGVFAPPSKGFSLTRSFQEMRRLLAQPTLNKPDADHLTKVARELANSLWLKATSNARQVRPMFAVVYLGSTFLAMDYVVSAVELLGDHMKLDLWWEKFAQAFDTNYNLPKPSEFCRHATKFHTELANELLEALDRKSTRLNSSHAR